MFCINLRTKDSESRLDISQRTFQKHPEDELIGDEPPSDFKGGLGGKAALPFGLSQYFRDQDEPPAPSSAGNPRGPGKPYNLDPPVLHQPFPLVPGNTSKSTFHSLRRVWHIKSLLKFWHKSFLSSGHLQASEQRGDICS